MGTRPIYFYGNIAMTYDIASNGVIHRSGCEHAIKIKTLSGDYTTIEDARRIAFEDFSKVRVAPCAKREHKAKFILWNKE
jgi:hypothetical protein